MAVTQSKPPPTTKQEKTEEEVRVFKRKRTISTFSMIFAFFLIIYYGHWAAVAWIVFCQILIFHELNTIMKTVRKIRDDPNATVLPWYNFFCYLYFAYGHTAITRFGSDLAGLGPTVEWLVYHHNFVCFSLYTLGFVGFVLGLRRGQYKSQFVQLAWAYFSILVTTAQSCFLVTNSLSGLIWFFFPASLIVCNDTQAYVFGKLYGKTPLIKLSPNKTWEGFIGATIMTFLYGFLAAGVLIKLPFLLCPKTTLSWGFDECVIDPVFVPVAYELPQYVVGLIGGLGLDWTTLNIAPFQLHAISLAAFASIIAPFGGFFASGFKRAFNLKDFGDSIPGHGGMTDRMDCQIVFGSFVMVYYNTFIHHAVTPELVLHMLTRLTLQQQKEVMSGLQKLIEN
eukprot:TRINITY_DN1602_c0_g1_i2.p1 TRINITY_DN1602_c0_g1~~TRINITY_DN1602_c0_g1_i2.p1  ORF type:complete len:395 (+),score=126.36 TRINITY_DN1602_c0_g1_i2:356-1540(+)